VRFDRLVKTAPQLLNSLRNPKRNLSLLMKAARNGKRDVFIKLLEYPQDLSIVHACDENVFYEVARSQNNEWWLDELKKKINDSSKLKVLLEKKSNRGSTSLHCAASNNNRRSVKWLLANGADVNATNGDGKRAYQLGDYRTKQMIRRYRK